MRDKASSYGCRMDGCANRGAILVRAGSMLRLGGVSSVAYCPEHAVEWRIGSLAQRRAWRMADRAPERAR